MKIEFFEDGLDGGPLILLYGGAPDEVTQLRTAVQLLSRDIGAHLVLNNLPFVQSVDQCRLGITCANNDLGVMDNGRADFDWILASESWLTVGEQLEPFCVHRAGVFFQYLNPGRGPEIIYSTAREW
jgi:hypothetical protein